MAASVSGSVSLQVAMTSVSALDLETASDILTLTKTYSFTNGTGAGKANKMFSDERTITSGGNESLDLSGVLTDFTGTALSFTKIKALIIISDPTNTVNITVGNGTNPVVGGPWGAAGANPLVLQPGDAHIFLSNSANGLFAVTNSTADILKVAVGAADSKYRIIIIGE